MSQLVRTGDIMSSHEHLISRLSLAQGVGKKKACPTQTALSAQCDAESRLTLVWFPLTRIPRLSTSTCSRHHGGGKKSEQSRVCIKAQSSMTMRGVASAV